MTDDGQTLDENERDDEGQGSEHEWWEKGRPKYRSEKRAIVTLDLEEKRLKAFEMRKQGIPVVRIAKELGIATTTAYDYIKYVLDNLVEKQHKHAESYRELQLARLDDALYLTIEYVRIKMKIEGVDRILKIIDMQNKLLGLYRTPARLVLTKDVTEMTDEEIEEALRAYNTLTTEEKREMNNIIEGKA